MGGRGGGGGREKKKKKNAHKTTKQTSTPTEISTQAVATQKETTDQTRQNTASE